MRPRFLKNELFHICRSRLHWAILSMTLATLYFGMGGMDHLNINFGWEGL